MHHVSSSESALLFTLCVVSENVKTSPLWWLAHCMYTVFILQLHHRSCGKPRASLKCVQMWLTSNGSFLFVCLFSALNWMHKKCTFSHTKHFWMNPLTWLLICKRQKFRNWDILLSIFTLNRVWDEFRNHISQSVCDTEQLHVVLARVRGVRHARCVLATLAL